MGKGVKSLITRVVALGVGVAVAVLLAQWWAARAERQFQEHLRHATVAELRVTAQKREWDPTVYYWLGVKLTEQAQPDEAVQVLTRAVGLDPHDAAARAALEKARAAAMARQQERLRYMGVPELKQLVALQPNNPESNYWLGVKLTEQGQPNEAVPVLARSLQVNPNSAGARTALGLALARTDKPGEAEEQLKQALALDPKLELAHFTLGSLYYKFGRWEETLKELKTAADLDPNDVDAQYLLATTYGEVFQEDKKLDILENLVRRDPDNTRYLTSLGYVYLFFGKFGQAEALYHKILTLTPNDQEAHYLYGRSLAEQASSPEEFAQAERELTGVIQKVPNDPGVHLALGILYFRRNESARAVPELTRVCRAIGMATGRNNRKNRRSENSARYALTTRIG